jgi:signal peptidase I
MIRARRDRSIPRSPRRLAGRVLGTTVMVVATLVGLTVVVPTLLGFHLYAITTGSMTGTIDPGSLALAREVPVGDLATGDVITYVPPPGTGISQLVTHRIADITEVDQVGTTFTTKGDANDTVDPWTFQLEAPTQARVEASVPLLGRPVLLLGDPRNRLLAVGVPALLIAALSIRELIQVLRRPRGVDESEAAPAAARPGSALVGAPPAELIVLPEMPGHVVGLDAPAERVLVHGVDAPGPRP